MTDVVSARRRRRWPFVVVGLVLLVTVAGGLWFRWFPEWRPGLKGNERYGIDVSSHQGRIDWERVAGDGVSFVYIKATEGSDFVDQRFRENWVGAIVADLDHGAYHFFTLCSPGDVQARHFLSTLPRFDRGELGPAVDLELAGNCRQRPPRRQVIDELNTFIRMVREGSGSRDVVLYVGDDFDSRYHIRAIARHPLWLRRFVRRPHGDWWIWQVHGYAHVKGISGSVDLDVEHGSDLVNL